ncbi:MAG TPA: SCE4755 family polysaccharide monooxygenase-like protein [Polyangiales bacterium]|jgi:hypothetical protein|nr:SCE4755 family polysaccharide monooxygenase-like protein [Polyangiales bacterium]
MLTTQTEKMTRAGFAILTCLAGNAVVIQSAHAHFKLLSPTSWLNETSVGGPQKGSPCGPGNTSPLGGDDVQPIPVSNAITEFHAGDTVNVQWVDTIAHPGHFRIALAANRDDLKDPDITQDSSCDYDESMVPSGSHGNVLADGVAFRTRNGFNAQAGMMFSQTVTLPDQPCDKCTLQVLQVMESDVQAISNCHYFHCADIKILPKVASSTAGASGSAGSSGSVAGGGSGGSSGSSVAGQSGSTAAANGGSTASSGISGSSGVGVSSVAGSSGEDASTPPVTPSGASGTNAIASTGATAAAGSSSAKTASTKSGGCTIQRPGSSSRRSALIGASLFGIAAIIRRRRRMRSR